MTDEELKAIRARAEAASPGPWEDRLDGWTVRDANGGKVAATYRADGTAEQQVNDQQFIAAARADVPALLAHADALRRERDAADGAFADYLAMGGPECDRAAEAEARIRADERARARAVVEVALAEVREDPSWDARTQAAALVAVAEEIDDLGPAEPLPASRLRAALLRIYAEADGFGGLTWAQGVARDALGLGDDRPVLEDTGDA